MRMSVARRAFSFSALSLGWGCRGIGVNFSLVCPQNGPDMANLFLLKETSRHVRACQQEYQEQ